MKAEDFLTAPSAEDFLTGADGSGEMTIPVRRRRGTEKARYVAPDNPDNPIAPAGLVAESIRMPAPTFDEERKGRTAVDALIAKTPAPAPRGPRPQRDIKAVAQDLYSILGNTGVQLVKPFVDIPNMMTGGTLDEASRFLNNAGQAANLAASPTTNYDRETMGLMPEGASLDKVGHLVSNPGLAANMGVPSAASMVMPLAATKAMGVLFPRTAAAMGEGFQTAGAVGSNALMNAGDTFGQTQGDTGGRLLAALGSGVGSALVGKATGGGLEGQLARGGKLPTWGAALKGIGNESLQEGGENFGNQLAQDTGEGKPLNFGAAFDQAAIGATLAPFVSGPINIAGVATSPERANARLLSDAINGFDPSVLFPNAPYPIVQPSGPRFDPVAAAAANMQPPAPPPAPIPQLGYDPTVQNQIPAMAVDSQGNARPMSAEEFLTADTQRQEQENIGLTEDVKKAIAARNVSQPAEAAPGAAPEQPSSDLLDRLVASGWTPPQEGPPKPKPRGQSIDFPEPVKPRPLTVERGMEILDAGKTRALMPQERGYLDELKKQIGPEDFQLLQDTVQQPFKVAMADRKFRVPKITEANRTAVSAWDQANAPKPPVAMPAPPAQPVQQQAAPQPTQSQPPAMPTVPRGAELASPQPRQAANTPMPQGSGRSDTPASRRAVEENLLTEGKTQTRYMGNKREFFQQNARFIARDVAPLTQQADTLFDMYAGGGTYGLTTALSGAMPNVRRVVVNEVDPVRASRFRLASERGAEIMRPWETDPKLQELAAQLQPLIGKSSTPAAFAMAAYLGQGKSQKYAHIAQASTWGELSQDSKVAVLALADVFFSGRTATWDRLMRNAGQDAERIRDLSQRARERGIAVDVTSHDSLGQEAVNMVRSKGGNAVVMLDPPYHTTSSGTYSAGGKKFDFASDDFLAANAAAARQMADGNVVLYNNKDTPLVRKHFSDNFGGSMVARGWKRQNGEREFLGVYDGRGKSGISGVPVRSPEAGLGPEAKDAAGRVLDRSGSNPGGPVETGAPSTVRGTGDQPATAGRGGSPDGESAGARRAVGRQSLQQDGLDAQAAPANPDALPAAPSRPDKSPEVASMVELRKGGMSADKAAIASVEERLAYVQEQLGGAKQTTTKAPEQSVETVRSALAKRFGNLTSTLEARGFLKIWPSTQAFNAGQTSEHLEGPVQGYWDGKQAHLFADGIAPGNEVAVLLHEVGEHASMEDMLGPNQYERLVSRAHDLVDQGDPTAVRAMDRIPDDTPRQYVDSELLAYMIETVAADGAKAAPGARKWLADTVAAIRAWFAQTGFNKMLDRYGKGLQLTPADIAALAVRAVKWQSEQSGPKVADSYSAPEKSGPDRLLVDAQNLGDMAQSPAFREQGLRGLDVPSQREMLASMVGVLQDDQIRRGVVQLVSVDVVQNLAGKKGSPDALLNDKSVLKHILAIDSDSSVPALVDVASDVASIVAGLAAKRLGSGSKSLSRGSGENDAATGAGKIDGTHVVTPNSDGMPGAEGVDASSAPPSLPTSKALGKFARPAQSTAAQQAANVFGGIAPPVAGNPAGPSAAAATPWSVAEPGRLDDLIRRLQDSRIDIKRAVESVKATGAQIADDANPYLMDELYIGKVRAQIDRLADAQVMPMLRAISNSGFTPAQVNDYLWARHAEERNRQMAKVNNVPFDPALDLAGMSTADANAKLAAARALPNFAQMQAIARMVDAITSDARTRIVTDGLEDASVIQAWEGAYKHYVPLQRDVEESGGKASGYNVKGPEARRAVGSSKEAVNILANVIAQAEATIIRAEKAAVGRSVLDMARQNPNPDFWTVDTPPTERAIDPRTGLVTTRVKPNYKALDNVFVVKEAGVEHFVTFNEKNPRAVQFARSLKNMNAANLGPVMQTISKATRYLASWVTSRNPLFWMTNFARDVQGVAFNLQSTSLKGQAPQVMAKIPQALAGVASNKLKGSGRWAQLAQEFADAGGQTGYLDNYRDSVERMGEIEKDIERMQQGRADPRRVARAVLDVVDGANDVIENGVRLAVYAQAREEGLSEAQSASIAKNISVNFNRKGNDTAAYNALYMFFNANVQGNVRMIQAIKDSRRAQIYAGALTLAGAAVALLNWQLGGDDEESRRKRYQLVPEWERERNWIVFIPGTDSYVKIPLPLGPHVLFNAGRVLSELGLEKGADPMEKAASFASSLIGAFNPVGGGLPSADAKGVAQVATPTVLRPITDLVVNQNFAGTPVAKEKSPFGYNKPAYANGRESTPSYWTTAAKALNDWTGGDSVKPGAANLSPEQLAYLVKGYVMPGITQTADKVAGQAMSRKDTPLDQIVGVSKFFGTIDEGERGRAAFETARKDREKAGQYQAYLKAGEREKANELLTQWGGGDPAVGRKLLGQAKTFEKLMAGIAKERRAVQTMPEDARDERLNRLDERTQRTQAIYLRNRAALTETADE